MNDSVQSYFDQMLDSEAVPAAATDAEAAPTAAARASSPEPSPGRPAEPAPEPAAQPPRAMASAESVHGDATAAPSAGRQPPAMAAAAVSAAAPEARAAEIAGVRFPTVAQLDAAAAARQASEQAEWVLFDLAGQCYALDVRGVREIVRPPPLEAVPHAPDSLRGVANMRGAVIAIFDSCRLLGQPALEAQPASRVIIIEHGDDVLGLYVDKVHEILRFDADRAEPPPPLGASAAHVVEVLRQPGRLVQRLDPTSLFR